MNTMIKSKEALKKRLVSGDVLIGSWLQIGHPAVMEYMASFDFDWLTVDMEHSDITIDCLTNMLRGADNYDKPVFARVKKNSALDIRQVLDVGASGVIVPLVNTVEDAEKAVSAAKYAPDGERGFAYCRANGYGRNFDEYAKNANDQVVVIIMIESIEAVDKIDALLTVDGVDGVIIGPYDLSGSYGVPGQTQSQCIIEAMGKVVSACKAHNKAAGIHEVVPDEGNISSIVQQGFSFIAVGMDNVFIGQAAQAGLEVSRRAIKEL